MYVKSIPGVCIPNLQPYIKTNLCTCIGISRYFILLSMNFLVNIFTQNCRNLKKKSVNYQSLNAYYNRRDVYQYFWQQNCSILCLFDTQFTPEIEQTVRIEWGYETYYSSFASKSRGIDLLLNNNFEFKVHEQI